jgi:hypothetical protein
MFTNIYKTMEQCKYEQSKKNHLVLVLRLETCICSITDTKMQGGTKQVIRVLDIEFESL